MGKRRQGWVPKVVDASGRKVRLRKYAQSTSGRTSSHLTAPELSRSNAITSSGPNFWPFEIPFRMYPTEVPHRAAKDSCPDESSEFRYRRSASIDNNLPASKFLSIPVGKLLPGKDGYHCDMSEMDQRRTSNFLAILRRDYGDSPKRFADETGYDPAMVSQIKTGKKIVGDRRARKLEKLMKLPSLELDKESPSERIEPLRRAAAGYWPFSFSAAEFQQLSSKLQREMDDAFTRMVIGAQTQQITSKQKNRA